MMRAVANRRFHYTQAFEHYLRANAIPFVTVKDAQRELHRATGDSGVGQGRGTLKNFDFVVYAQSDETPNLLVAVKGRKHAMTTGKSMQNWVGREDVDDLNAWADRFGGGFEPAFCFLFWCDVQPPDALFLETFAYDQRWYAPLAIRLSDYAPHMRDRSAKWGTVSIPNAMFVKHAVPIRELVTP